MDFYVVEMFIFSCYTYDVYAKFCLLYSETGDDLYAEKSATEGKNTPYLPDFDGRNGRGAWHHGCRDNR